TEEDAMQEGDSAGMGPGGKYTIKQLLTGLLMVSGNDTAHALATQLGGMDATVKEMNAKAVSLGALDTRAATPSGLDGPGMSSSPYDLALIFRHAMQDNTFASIVSQSSAEFPGYPKRKDLPQDDPENVDHPAYTMYTQNHLLERYPGAIGGKTGYTDDAQKTYVGAAQKNGRRLVLTQMFGLNESASYWDQAEQLFDWGFSLSQDNTIGTLTEAQNHSNAHKSDATSSVPQADSAAYTQTRTQETPTGTAVRIGFGIIGLVVISGLLLGARRLNKNR
ncbi:MAG: D-alanyl-D-alanine carboxypeptidase family protein, partial [Mycobacteriaceae bacterium]